MKRLLLSLALIIPSLSYAQTYPDHPSPYVNDYAHLLSDDAEMRLVKQLTQLKMQTGVEATILTIQNHTVYGHSGSLEQFATGLFNHWGIGDASVNNGILILVERQARQMRIELGQGYGKGYNRLAASVIDDTFIPYFKANKYEEGIEAGTAEVLRKIARPFAKGNPAPTNPKSGGWGQLAPFFILIMGVVLHFRTSLTDIFMFNRKCPSCGQKTLSRTRVTIRTASKLLPGKQEETTICSNCDYHNTSTRLTQYHDFNIRLGGGGGSFGGGSSSGGGGSGRW